MNAPSTTLNLRRIEPLVGDQITHVLGGQKVFTLGAWAFKVMEWELTNKTLVCTEHDGKTPVGDVAS